MSEQTKARRLDILYLAMIIAPFVLAIALKVINKPVEEGITITGALIYLTIPMPLQDLYITESQVNSWAVMIALMGLCLYLTHGMKLVPGGRSWPSGSWKR